MSAPTFKVGDRIRCGRHVGVVDRIAESGWIAKAGWIRFSGTGTLGTWTRWVDPLQQRCTLCPPMSPEVKMVWHAMRAGAKRTARFHDTRGGITYRIHRYTLTGDILAGCVLTARIALPPLAEDEAGR